MTGYGDASSLDTIILWILVANFNAGDIFRRQEIVNGSHVWCKYTHKRITCFYSCTFLDDCGERCIKAFIYSVLYAILFTCLLDQWHLVEYVEKIAPFQKLIALWFRCINIILAYTRPVYIMYWTIYMYFAILWEFLIVVIGMWLCNFIIIFWHILVTTILHVESSVIAVNHKYLPLIRNQKTSATVDQHINCKCVYLSAIFRST